MALSRIRRRELGGCASAQRSVHRVQPLADAAAILLAHVGDGLLDLRVELVDVLADSVLQHRAGDDEFAAQRNHDGRGLRGELRDAFRAAEAGDFGGLFRVEGGVSGAVFGGFDLVLDAVGALDGFGAANGVFLSRMNTWSLATSFFVERVTASHCFLCFL